MGSFFEMVLVYEKAVHKTHLKSLPLCIVVTLERSQVLCGDNYVNYIINERVVQGLF